LGFKRFSDKPDVWKVSANGVVIVSAFIGVQLMTLAHELGHATAALLLTKRGVGVRVGRIDPAVKLRLGRLIIRFSPVGAGGFCVSWPTVSRRQALVRVLAGPATNLLLAVLLWIAGLAAAGTTRLVLFTLSGVSGKLVLSLIPYRSTRNPITRGRPSDGLRALWLIRNRPVPLPPPSSPENTFWNPDEMRQIGIGLAFAAVGVVVVAAFGEVVLWVLLSMALQEALAGGLTARPPKMARRGQA